MSTVVAFDHVAKRYRRGRERTNIRAAVPGRFGRGVSGEVHWALRDLTFELRAGESIGIVGPNGAGKSTALKLVSNVISPTSGTIVVKGRTASLIELGAGFHPDMTGRENIHFSAALLGMSPVDTRERLDQIVDFAAIGAYLDSPVKRYSSGMLARLGFAIASHLDVDVLVLDEVLAVGDADFQRKCHARINELRRDGAALLYVTHALWTLPMLCESAILLVDGTVTAQGTPHEVLHDYERLQLRHSWSDGPAALGRVIRDFRYIPEAIEPGGTVDIELDLDVTDSFPRGRVQISLTDSQERIFATVTTEGSIDFTKPGSRLLRCHMADLHLQPGQYGLLVTFIADDRTPVIDDIRSSPLEVLGPELDPAYGPVRLSTTWTDY